SEDKPTVRKLHEQLVQHGFHAWLDEDDIFPARPWNEEIESALHASHAIVICLSREFEHKEGFVRRELAYAMDLATEKLDRALFLIPVRLEDCNPPWELRPYQYIDLFLDGGFEKIETVLRERAKQLGIAVPEPVAEQPATA